MSKQDKHEEDVIVNVQEVYSKTESFLEENQKAITTVVLAIVIVIGGYFGYKNLYLLPQEKEASELIWKAEYYLEKGDYTKAIEGDGNYYGLAYIAEEYNNTKTGELANYYLGTAYLQQGEYELAIDYLSGVNLDDEVTGAVALGATGDAYAELGNYDKAISYFKKAVNHSSNQFTAPLYLMKEALVLEEVGSYDEALENYKTIKEKYPNSNQARDIDKYISRVASYVS